MPCANVTRGMERNSSVYPVTMPAAETMALEIHPGAGGRVYESQNNELCAVGAQGEAIATGSVPIEWCAFGCRRYAPR